jgi:hypothetical protein
MTADERAPLAAEVAAAEADVTRLRAENGALAEDFRDEPTEDKREILKRAAASLSAARDRVEVAKAALALFDKLGTPHGLVADGGSVAGTIAIAIKPGATSQEREKAIEAALDEQLNAAAESLGVVLAASPAKYTKERPGRDAEGRMVLEVAGRVEGDRLVPAVSRQAKNLRRN